MSAKSAFRALAIGSVLFYEATPPAKTFLDWLQLPWPNDPIHRVHADFGSIRDILLSLPKDVQEFSFSDEIRNDPLSHQRFVSIGFPLRCTPDARHLIIREKGSYHVEIRR